jgi:hypothetical protein
MDRMRTPARQSSRPTPGDLREQASGSLAVMAFSLCASLLGTGLLWGMAWWLG